MHLSDFPLQFQKLSEEVGLQYSLAEGALDEQISEAEERLGVVFPAQVAMFYRNFNGLMVQEPALEVLSLERLDLSSANRLHFATLDGWQRLHFDLSGLNSAQQWDILSADEYRVTATMASFWSNKIFAWIKNRRRIWLPWQDEGGEATIE